MSVSDCFQPLDHLKIGRMGQRILNHLFFSYFDSIYSGRCVRFRGKRLSLSHFRYVASTHKFSYVPEGASCGDGRFCFQNRCIKPTAIVIHSKCPKGPYLNPWGVSDGSNEYIHPAVRRSLPTAIATPINITCSGRGVT